MISDKDMARITLSLEGVGLVRDLLDGKGDDIDLDLLTSLLIECPPEKCLLLLSCAAHLVCQDCEIDAGIKVSLKLLSGDVMDDYGPLYLARLKSKEAEHYEAQIIYMQEDLEGYGELFALSADLSPSHTALNRVCCILSDCAMAQAEFLNETEIDIDYSLDGAQEEKPDLVVLTGNVVPFPGLFRKN